MPRWSNWRPTRRSPLDRGITGKLYDASSEIRLLQEMVLGIGGW
jgi:starch phosphorylase